MPVVKERPNQKQQLAPVRWKFAAYVYNRYSHVPFRLVDFICLGYLALIGFLLIFFHKNVHGWLRFVAIHALIIFVILELVRSAEKKPQLKILWILRTFYLILVILFCWNEMNGLLLMFYGDFWMSNVVIRIDKFIFGVHPTLWVQQFYRPWLDELMYALYSGYYLFTPIVSVTLFIKKKKEETLAGLSIASLAYLSNYVLFYILPAVGPQHVGLLQELSLAHSTGYFFGAATRLIQANGGVMGAAFPSSHITGVVVWTLVAFRYQRKLAYALMPLAVGVAVSTVYLGYHYAVDPLSGFIWGAICFFIALKWLKKRGEDPKSTILIPKKKAKEQKKT